MLDFNACILYGAVTMTKVVCWNIRMSKAPWYELLQMDADVALIQEAGKIPSDLASSIDTGSETTSGDHWNDLDNFDRWPLVVKLSDRVRIEWFKRILPLYRSTACDEMVVSDMGTIAAARVIPQNSDPFIAVSMYARWIRPHPSAKSSWKVGNSDVSAHRIISDLSQFIGHHVPSKHRILAAGDLNTIYECTDTSLVIPERERTIFDRMDALGIEFIGPRYPNGRKAEPTPYGLPQDTLNVPTYYTTHAKSPENAQHQLDYVFASRGFHKSVCARALNEPKDWGSSDHCRIEIEVKD